MTTTGKWLLRQPLQQSPMRLFCFPFAGVGASALRRWPARAHDFDICPVQLPGRDNRMREQPYRDFESFAADAADALAPAMDCPFILFGHCMGALLAYALLVRLEDSGGPLPMRLVVSSSLVPHRGFFGPFHPSMSDERLARDLRTIARVVGNGELHPDLEPLAIRVLRNDVEMCFGYCPPGPRRLPCPITTIGWSNDMDVQPQEMKEWEEYGYVRHHVLAGDAFTVLGAASTLLETIHGDVSALSPAPTIPLPQAGTATGESA